MNYIYDNLVINPITDIKAYLTRQDINNMTIHYQYKKTMAPEESENKFSCYNFFELFYGTNLKFISGIKINNNNFKVYYILNYFLII